MSWGSSREYITAAEAKGLGLDHDLSGALISASPSRKSIVVDHGQPTGFIKRKDGWYVVLYDGYMAGQFQRRPNNEAVPYETWKGWFK